MRAVTASIQTTVDSQHRLQQVYIAGCDEHNACLVECACKCFYSASHPLHATSQQSCAYVDHITPLQTCSTALRQNSMAQHNAAVVFSEDVQDAAEPGTATEAPVEEFETDPKRLCARQKQIEYGKATEGYRNYLAAVARYNLQF